MTGAVLVVSLFNIAFYNIKNVKVKNKQLYPFLAFIFLSLLSYGFIFLPLFEPSMLFLYIYLCNTNFKLYFNGY